MTSLRITNLRAIKAAEFRFRPGINLLVGAKGVGKSTVLEAATKGLSAAVKRANEVPSRVKGFQAHDVRAGADAMEIRCAMRIEDTMVRYVTRRPRGGPASAGFRGPGPVIATGGEPSGRPLAVWFTTGRAFPSERKVETSVAADGLKGAFGDALMRRALRLGELTAWMRDRAALGGEHPLARRALEAFEAVTRRFLPGCRNLRVEDRQLLIDHSQGTVGVRHMSDGERSVLAIVLDVTRRLVQANPEMDDPVSKAEAVVLIDEIDLHLHPEWQRRIVERLTSTFPRCQFIATTHSPQVIGEVESDRIHIMTEDAVYSPGHSFGVDSSRVLEEIMGVSPRTERVQNLLGQVADAIAGECYGTAKEKLDDLKRYLGESDPETVRIDTLLEFLGVADCGPHPARLQVREI